ncbi:MAG: ATP-dependent RNA helicase HrpA [Corynebacterium sp.]|uniref:ATP-dependent RNA helicase HrpA n=1 Tax=Corynebacterium sp. TaxID=1720 RepID=UPI0026DCAA7A|nr:ATP-dependent RNA helicase HrpA [Corynebacterium sp.]MDO4760719.1 ATP-dependent RNA helicase HrpA [Corynebacterium sp.]
MSKNTTPLTHNAHTDHTPTPRTQPAESAQQSQKRRGKTKRRRTHSPLSPDVIELRNTLTKDTHSLALNDAHAFRRRITNARSLKALQAIATDMSHARERLHARLERIPEITYPKSLPVSARKDDIAEAISNNQVVIIAGETGSGKTTQIPKICLELGRGRTGLIGHTQPRRLAARTVAERIADELGQRVGDTVGYAIRFDDHVNPTTTVKLMTDGILLAEMQHDRYLNAYDTIIIDEAHERSLNIDFILGYLKQLLRRRKDLKVIITSATIDPERFAEHFVDADGNPAPIIEVSGRTYPVEILYRPLQVEMGDKTIDIDPIDGLLSAIEELMEYGDGDILCFFPGEADIREAMEAIEARRYPNVEVTPLFGRLSNQEQHKVFSPHSTRRIVLSTNIAETSLTVPGIHFVIDTGTARISRYSTRTKVQRLPIEPISQASANQRSGRCGRVADGIAIRLYSEQDFLSRPEFTDPEIVRTNLASVILQMAALKLGDIEEFPFIQAPDTRAIRDGLALLHELGALEQRESSDGNPQLTPIGRDIARIPLDPRMARMLVEANRLGVLREAQIVVAALSIQDVRERPLEFQAQADQQHARFTNKSSDFLSYLTLWEYVTGVRNENTGNAFKKRMTQEFLHYMRIREWFDLVRQLKAICEQIGWTKLHDSSLDRLIPESRDKAKNSSSTKPFQRVAQALVNVTENPRSLSIDPAQATALHQSLLAGLLSHIGIRQGDTREYIGARNTRFAIFPGSSVAKSTPQCVMASELVETSRLWARDVAEIDPAWVEKLAAGLLKHQYSDPHWSHKRASAVVNQRSTLYGVPIVTDRLIPYHHVDQEAARAMFIRHALVNGEWSTTHHFFHENVRKLDEAMDLENRARRRDIVVDEETLVAFYDARIPAHVASGASFDNWWKKNRAKNPTLLDFDPDALVYEQAAEVTEADFPSLWHEGELEFELSYQFAPGTPDDGVTVCIPVPLLAGLSAESFQWLVPGMRLDLVTELIRGLPKTIRRTVVPAPDFAARVLPLLQPNQPVPLALQLAQALRKVGGQGINAEDFNFAGLPQHLRMTFAAIDRRGKVIDTDKSLTALKERRQGQIKSSVSQVTQGMELPPATHWTSETLGSIPQEFVTEVDGQKVTTFPALVATADGVALKVMGTQAEADASMITATLTLLLRQITVNASKVLNGLPLKERVGVENFPHGGAAGLVEDARVSAVRDALMAHGGAVRDPDVFAQLAEKIRGEVPSLVRQMVVQLAPALVDFHALQLELSQRKGPAIEDMKDQLAFLLPKNAVTIHGISRLRHLQRYLAAMKVRLEEMRIQPTRDSDRQDIINDLEDLLAEKLSKLPPNRSKTTAVKDIQWMMQELRVSFFAQRLGTAYKVSESKIAKAIAALR